MISALRMGGIEESLKQGSDFGDEKWAESIGVGSRRLWRLRKEALGLKAKGREVIIGGGVYGLLQSSAQRHKGLFGA